MGIQFSKFESLEISYLENDAQTFLKTSSEAKNRFWIKTRTGGNMGEFPACPINKAVPRFRNGL